MPQNHRPPRTNVINIAAAIGIPKIRPLRTLHKTRRTPHSTKSTHRRIDPAWNHPLRTLVQALVEIGCSI